MLSAKFILLYLLQTSDVTGLGIDTSKVDPAEAYCLAENIYHESKSEDIQGQFAVASVTLNRVNDPRYPKTVCGVISQSSTPKANKKAVCAFSWYCENNKRGKEIPVKNKDGTINQQVIDQFQVASIVAITVLSGTVEDNTRGATHFHNPSVSSPQWKYVYRKTASMGNHDFYKAR